ncbi:MAG: RNA polymerase sigma factor [Candidatus Eisenbacteria bacterium]|uniref:RNA polymerase sigma factor n=1 Tax=Eiseniibacteriota bacterium TaxID=2212470 RepID=A0A849SQA1_UNCEI|nr:RNA polymerase sigma factor [Candidatus Eisenbacteria bacterium]
MLERACTGDPSALGEFFDHYFARVFATVRRLVGDPTAAEDITQDVFLKVHRHMNRLDPARDPAPWLFTVALNACRDFWRSESWRRARRTVPLEDPSIALQLHAKGAGPEQAFAQAEDQRRLLEAIDRLPPPLRAAVVLRECEGLDHREIADLTRVNYAASRKRHSRGLQALGELLREGESR